MRSRTETNHSHSSNIHTRKSDLAYSERVCRRFLASDFSDEALGGKEVKMELATLLELQSDGDGDESMRDENGEEE